MTLDANRLWNRVNKTATCWEWIGGKTGRGYGSLMIDGRQWMAHRLSWTITYGPIPDGKFICHRCDNPACVRPSHLFLGDQFANMQDMVAKGRSHAQNVTHCPAGHPYNDRNTYLYKGGRGCRRCRSEQVKASRNRRKK